MRLLLKNTAIDGRPLAGDGQIFTGRTRLDVVKAMTQTTPFAAERGVDGYIDMVAGAVERLLGVGLTIKGSTSEDRAAAFIDALVEHGFAEVLNE